MRMAIKESWLVLEPCGDEYHRPYQTFSTEAEALEYMSSSGFGKRNCRVQSFESYIDDAQENRNRVANNFHVAFDTVEFMLKELTWATGAAVFLAVGISTNDAPLIIQLAAGAAAGLILLAAYRLTARRVRGRLWENLCQCKDSVDDRE